MTTATMTTKTIKARRNGKVRVIAGPNGITWNVTDSRYYFTGGIMFVSGTKYRVRIDRGGNPWRNVEVTGAGSAEAAWEIAVGEAVAGRGETI